MQEGSGRDKQRTSHDSHARMSLVNVAQVQKDLRKSVGQAVV
jgi:hypothetical protein